MNTLTRSAVDVTRYGGIVRIESRRISELVRTVADDLAEPERRDDLAEYADAKAAHEESLDRDSCMSEPETSEETERLGIDAEEAFKRLDLSDCLALPVAEALELAYGILAALDEPVGVIPLPRARTAA